MQKTHKVKILSAASFTPSQIVNSLDLFEEIKSESQYGVPKNWMVENMGIIERRVSEDLLPSELAIPAAIQAINKSGLTNNDIDAVIFCGIERDRPEPATAHTIASELGINSKHSFDVSNACFGFLEGIMIANSHIKSGQCENVLICTGEIPSHVLLSITDKLKKGVKSRAFSRYIGGLSVGDAGGAVVLTRSNDDTGFGDFDTVTKTKYLNHCYYKYSSNGECDFQMKMGQLAAAMIKTHAELFRQTKKKISKKPKFLLSHQVGKKPFHRLSDMMLENPVNHMKTFDKFGNVASASLPLGFEQLLKCDKVKKGDEVIGCFNGSGAVAGQFIYTF